MLSYHRMISQSTHTAITCLLGMALLSLWPSLGSAAPTLPTLPQKYIDTTYASPAGNTITVNAGGDFQAALNNANLGDTIVLQAGATFTGPFTLPNKTSGSGWIYIRSSNYSSLPAPGSRVAPTDAANMPKIVVASNVGGAIQTAANAHHYRFVGIELTPVTGKFVYSLIAIGNGETSTAALPHDITFDRCYIHGDSTVGSRRGIAMEGASVAVIDSYVSDFKEVGADTQALWANNSPGPLKIVNNYLEAAGENVMFGGSDIAITNLVPSDIEIKRNYFFKPLSWMGSSWSVKNLLEFKNAQRILVEGNLFENNWLNAQVGFSILMTPRTSGGIDPWCVTQDITLRLNTLKNLGSGINISATDDADPTIRAQRILIQNNVIEVTGLGGADGRTFQVLSGVKDLTIDHNTGFIVKGNALMFSEASSLRHDQFDFKNNLASYGGYGFACSGTGDGTKCLDDDFTNWQFAKNAIITPTDYYWVPTSYPSNNFFPADISKVGFVNYAGSDYHLSSSSPYKNAGTDGKDLGADIDAIANATIGIQGSVTLAKPLNLRVVH